MNNHEIVGIIAGRLKNCVANYPVEENPHQRFATHENAAIMVLDGCIGFNEQAELYLLGYLDGMKVALGLTEAD